MSPTEPARLRTHLRRLAGQTLIYGLGDAASRVVSLLLLPVYAHVFLPEEYGRLAVATLVGTLVGIVLEAGQRTAFFRLYYANDDRRYRARLTGTVLLYLLASAALVVPALLLLLPLLASVAFSDQALVPLLRLSLGATFFEIGSVVPFAIFRARQEAGRYARVTLTRFLATAALNLFAVLVLKTGAAGILWANLFTSAFFFVYCLRLTMAELEWGMDWSLLRRLLTFGLPFIPANLAGWVLTLSDRYFLERFSGLGVVGVYAVGYSIAGVLNMMMGWFNTAWAPYCMSLTGQAEAPRLYSRFLTYAFAAFCCLGLGLSLLAAPVLRLLAAEAYAPAASIVPWIVLSCLFYELYYVLSLGFDLTGRTRFPAIAIGLAALLNTGLNLLLIPRLGMTGAAVATAVSYALLPLLVYPVVQGLYHVPYELGRLSRLLLLAVACALAGIRLQSGGVLHDTAWGVGLVLVWGGLLALTGFFTPEERRVVGQSVRRIRQRARGVAVRGDSE